MTGHTVYRYDGFTGKKPMLAVARKLDAENVHTASFRVKKLTRIDSSPEIYYMASLSNFHGFSFWESLAAGTHKQKHTVTAQSGVTEPAHCFS
jgi:hypothetical protein